jgi:hypothetical protein
MALDEKAGRLFLGTRDPARLLVLDATSGRVLASVAIGADTDDIFFDDARQRIYAICGDGTVSVIDKLAGDRYQVGATVKTAPGARTGLFVPEFGSLFVAVPARDGQGSELQILTVH